jgi:hypothetical protein
MPEHSAQPGRQQRCRASRAGASRFAPQRAPTLMRRARCGSGTTTGTPHDTVSDAAFATRRTHKPKASCAVMRYRWRIPRRRCMTLRLCTYMGDTPYGLGRNRSFSRSRCRCSAHRHILAPDIQRAGTHGDERRESLLATRDWTSFDGAEGRNENPGLAMPRHWSLSRHFHHVRNRLRAITITGGENACALARPTRRKVGYPGIDTIRRQLGILRRYRRPRAMQPLPAAATWKAHLRYMVVFRFGQKLRGPGHRRGDVLSGSATQPDLRPSRQRDPHRVRNRLGDHRPTLALVQRQARRPGRQGWPLLR